MKKLLIRLTNQQLSRSCEYLGEKRIVLNNFVKSRIWNLETVDQSQSSKAATRLPGNSPQSVIGQPGAQSPIDDDVKPRQHIMFHCVSQRYTDCAQGKKLKERKISHNMKQRLMRWPCFSHRRRIWRFLILRHGSKFFIFLLCRRCAGKTQFLSYGWFWSGHGGKWNWELRILRESNINGGSFI